MSWWTVIFPRQLIWCVILFAVQPLLLSEETLGSGNDYHRESCPSNPDFFTETFSVTQNILYGLWSLGGLDSNTEWIIVELTCRDSCCGTAWYSLPPPHYFKGYGWWGPTVWTCNGTCSQEHINTLTSFWSTVAFAGALSLVWPSTLFPVQPFLLLMLPWFISIFGCTNTKAWNPSSINVYQSYLITSLLS